MKLKWFLIIIICLRMISCGVNRHTGLTPQKPGQIYNVHWAGNNLSFDTIDSTFVKMTITSIDETEQYTATSAGGTAKNHTYSLPLTPGTSYAVALNVHNNATVKDTTLYYMPNTVSHPLMKVHFINVQQGDAILIQTPDGKNIQVDGGYGTRSGESWAGGRQPLALRYLQQQGITHLDYIIETHHHADHYGGLIDITNSDITYTTYISVSNPGGYSVGATLNLQGSPVNIVFFSIGYPPGYIGSNLNNTSIVFKATYGEAEFLFTGDAEGEVQDWLYTTDFNLSVDVLKVAHHGAESNNTTSDRYLLETLNQHTKIATLSYGLGNPYNHPRALGRFRGIETYGTNPVSSPPTASNYHFNCGTILVATDGKLIFVSTER